MSLTTRQVEFLLSCPEWKESHGECMTVKQLIDKLQQMRPESLVVVKVTAGNGKEVFGIGNMNLVENDMLNLVYLETDAA